METHRKYRPYSILTPAFDTTSGGIRVMYGLHGWLLARGQISYINATYEDKDFVGIYPEIYNGNDARANKVVRYILATPGTMSSGGIPSPTTQDFKTNPQYKNDIFYVFSKIYNTMGVDDDHIMFLPVLNLHLFKSENKKKRKKTCYLVGKGINTFKHPEDSIELTRAFASDQKALADLLNECHTLYCYDRLSAMMEIARLCGCRVKYYGNFSKEELSLYEPGINGITYHDEEDVPLKTDEFRQTYVHLTSLFEVKLDKFIEETQS